MAPDPHTAVKQELLVRYLDFWVPAAVGGPGRRAACLDTSAYGPAAAIRVFAEFADLLAGRELSLLVTGEPPPDPGLDGLQVATAPADLPAAVAAGPVLAHLAGGPDSALAAALATARGGGEVLAIGPPEPGDPRQPLYAAGFAYVVAVELVDAAGSGQLLRFATSASRSLERFKDELWAVDEFAGVRYRDPTEPDAVPLDISIEPHPGPLRRALLAQLAEQQPQTVNDLRAYALARTLYRPADVIRALQPLLSRGALTREPERGRLTGTTQLRLAA